MSESFDTINNRPIVVPGVNNNPSDSIPVLDTIITSPNPMYSVFQINDRSERFRLTDRSDEIFISKSQFDWNRQMFEIKFNLN